MSETELVRIARTLEGQERKSFLDKHCGGDASLRARVLRTLADIDATIDHAIGDSDTHPKTIGTEHAPESEFEFEIDHESFATTARNRVKQPTRIVPDHPASGVFASGDVIDKYTLVRVIGEGGMGEVWLADQEQPVTRQVAVKLIKSGSLDRNVIARFEAEQQALAMMNHVNIARVIDGGIANSGSPYFVMEYVDGIPINRFCDLEKLDPEARLRLFVSVCEAVQHAHLKGIMHRDLKPSNVLVTVREDRPIVKVIDFGLAKALQNEAKLTDKTMQTEIGQVLGTLQYMSPEQASLEKLDIDTRSDVYSLGVMLYQLLAGSTPLDKETLKKNALLKVLELIRENDPPRPSSRLDIESEPTESISKLRSVKSLKLKQVLERDLDWIVMKAIERDRDRRYESPSDFADDITRYLDGEAVDARPPTTSYRARKFLRKYKTLVATSLGFFVLLAAGIAGTTWFAIKANNELKVAEAARSETAASAKRSKDILSMITQAFKNTKPEVLANNNLLATDVLVNAEKLKDEAELDPLGQSLLLETITNSLIALHEYELALPVAESRTQVCINAFGKLDPESLRARIRQADCIQFCGRKNDSFQFRADIKDEVRNAYGQGHIEYRRLLVAQGKLFLEMQNWRRAINNLESGAIGLEESLGKDDPETISALHSLAEANAGFMDYEHASKVRKKLHEHYVRVNGLNDEQTLRAKQHLGYAYVRNNNVGVGISLLKEAVQDVDIVHPGNSAKKNSTMNYLALGYQMANKVDEEVRVRERALEYSLEHFGRHHPYHVYAKARLSRAYRRAKQIEKSDALIQTIDIDESKSETWTKHSIDQLDIAATNLFNDDKDELALRLYKIVFNARVRMLGRANTLTFETEGSIALATFYTGDKLEGLRQIMALYDRGREQVGRRNYRVRHISEKWNFMANHFVSSLPRMIANDENEQAEEILKLLVRYEGEEQQDILEESFELLHSIYLKQKRFEEAQKVVDSWIKFLNENKGIGIGRHYELETVVARPKELNEKLLAWARTSKARCELGLGAFLDAEKTANDALSNEFITAANQSRCEVVIAVCEAEAGSSIDAKKRAVDAFNKIESRRSSATVDLLWFYTDACENIIRICESANDAEGVKLWKMKLKKLEEENRNAKRKFVRRTPETSLYPSQTN